MTDQPDLSTLPQRMRYADAVLGEARDRYHADHRKDNAGWPATSWDGTGLRAYAEKWEAEDRAVAERDAQVEQLAREMFDANRPEHGRQQWDDPYEVVQGAYMAIARDLVESGWRKGDPAS